MREMMMHSRDLMRSESDSKPMSRRRWRGSRREYVMETPKL
jgi:hypothetical protein